MTFSYPLLVYGTTFPVLESRHPMVLRIRYGKNTGQILQIFRWNRLLRPESVRHRKVDSATVRPIDNGSL